MSARRAVLGLVLCALAAPVVVRAVERPPLLRAHEGCEVWIGTSSGNDPSVRVEMELCEDASGHVTGTSQWSSTRSGYNIRDLDGVQAADVYTLRDLRVREAHPEPGWRFCTVDRYTLRRTGDTIAGTYDSAACEDHGTLSLTLAPTVEGGGGGGPGTGGGNGTGGGGGNGGGNGSGGGNGTGGGGGNGTGNGTGGVGGNGGGNGNGTGGGNGTGTGGRNGTGRRGIFGCG